MEILQDSALRGRLEVAALVGVGCFAPSWGRRRAAGRRARMRSARPTGRALGGGEAADSDERPEPPESLAEAGPCLPVPSRSDRGGMWVALLIAAGVVQVTVPSQQLHSVGHRLGRISPRIGGPRARKYRRRPVGVSLSLGLQDTSVPAWSSPGSEGHVHEHLPARISAPARRRAEARRLAGALRRRATLRGATGMVCVSARPRAVDAVGELIAALFIAASPVASLMRSSR